MKKYQKQTADGLAYSRRYTAAVPGRRAKQVAGVLVAVKAEVPPGKAAGRLNPCALCPDNTNRPPDAAGKYVCGECRPAPRPVPRGKVGRLCVRCDRQVVRLPADKGPFLCDRCTRYLTTGQHDKPGRHTVCNQTFEEGKRAARVDRLADLYAEVAKHAAESVARAAGIPTTLEEFHSLPEVRNDTTASSDRDGDGDEADDAS